MFTAKTSAKGAGAESPRISEKTSSGKPAMPSIVSSDLTVNGGLVSEGDIQIDGNVEGDVKTTRLTIGEGGSVKGAITADTVTVAGAVVGQIRAKTIVLARTSRVQGDIWHDSLAIEAGAQFEGTCKRLNAAEATTQSSLTSWAANRRSSSSEVTTNGVAASSD